MDQQVSYSTVDIYLREVATLTPTGVTFGERIADAFGGGWDAFVGFLQGLVIALVYLWPVLLIGSHSVMPSTIPSRITFNHSMMFIRYVPFSF